ncbi:MAG: cohesin domain-containing protein [Actinomyces sp.]|jgi:hypothetical protein|nr:cohesin domain-containing protein [Actinomyces sp.]MCI1642909.1 cohesin domain-containing protein [Actinomyces sp.]MCI1787395.1 cohesin domain-containing protein [Actinomyces sp.]MCI1830787.1 cohesin domain-containing protein [Actinomyces sp.]
MRTARPARPPAPRLSGTSSHPLPSTTPHRGVPRLLAAAAAAAVWLLPAAPALADPVIGSIAVDAPDTATVGEEFSVVVSAEGLEDLYSYEITLAYDPGLLSVDESSTSTPAGGFADTEAEAADGALVIRGTRLGTSPGLSGDQDLATVSLTASSAGAASLALVSMTAIDSQGEAVDLRDLDAAAITIAAAQGGGGSPSPTPSPDSSSDASPAPDRPDDAGGADSGPLADTGSPVTSVVLTAAATAALGAGAVAARASSRRGPLR